MWNRRAAGAAVALALAATCQGCFLSGLFGGTGSRIDLHRKRLVVLPFATPNRPRFESAVGARFSKEVAELVRDGCPSATVLEAEELPEEIDGNPIAELSVMELADGLKADYLVVGEILVLRGKDPKSFKVLHGTMVLSARVVDVAKAEIAWKTERRTYHYPELLGGEPLPATEQDETDVIKKVMREAAWGVAEVFRGPRDPDEGKYIR